MSKRRLMGTLNQTGNDVDTSISFESGALHSSFQAVKLLYVRFVLSTFRASSWVLGSEFNVSIKGSVSQEGVIFAEAYPAIGRVPCVFEWEEKLQMPVMFDEILTLTLASNNTAQTNGVDYLIFYEIVDKKELELVQAIAGY